MRERNCYGQESVVSSEDSTWTSRQPSVNVFPRAVEPPRSNNGPRTSCIRFRCQRSGAHGQVVYVLSPASSSGPSRGRRIDGELAASTIIRQKTDVK